MISALISGVLTSLANLILNILDILPGSPFGGMISQLKSFDFLPFLNWFIPFDFCLVCFNAWLLCIGAYYVYSYARTFLNVAGVFK